MRLIDTLNYIVSELICGMALTAMAKKTLIIQSRYAVGCVIIENVFNEYYSIYTQYTVGNLFLRKCYNLIINNYP